MSQKLFVGLLAVLAASPALAQQAPAGAAATNGGPPVPGVCMLSREAVFANAKIGLAATARLRELAQPLQAQVDARRAPIDADEKALLAQKAHLSSAEFDQRQQAIAVRAQALQNDINNAKSQVERTRNAVSERIWNEAQPVIASAYAAHKCGLLLDRGVVLAGNRSGDLTADVVSGLDAKLTTITFELEPLTPPPAK